MRFSFASSSFARRLFFVIVTCAFAIGALVACSAILGDFDVVPGSGTTIDAGPGSTGDSSTPLSDGNTSSPDTGTQPGTDSGTGVVDSGTDSGPKTFCDTFVPPTGSTQSTCVDFDGLILGTGFDAVQVDGGTIQRNILSVSSPSSGETTITGGTGANGDDANWLWKKVGAKNFNDVTVDLQINPGTTGGVMAPTQTLLELIDVRTSTASMTFGYARGSTSFGGGVAYTGYYVLTETFGGAAALTFTKMPQQLPANTWTNLKITWDKAGATEVFYAGTSIVKPIGYGSADSEITMRIGPHTAVNVGSWQAYRFDNVELSIRRVP